ncbi:MAG: DUF4469 domain-containing protein [Anaerolineae bacterium]|nr:DUF4469 domain-containing protein [Anaerolineae bacterium]
MSVNFSLCKSNFSAEANQYRAVVQPAGTVNLDGVIDRMLIQHSTITRADILAVLDNYYTAIEGLLLDGFNIVTPGANYRTSVKGSFNGQGDGFTPGRNTVEATLSPGLQLRRAIEKRANVQKQEANERRPKLLDYLDLNSGELNSLVTPGGMGQVIGYRLKFDPADPEQGIFFIVADNKATRVSVVGKNTAAELMFLVPATLVPGDYSLELRTTMGNHVIRTGTLAATLTVG